MLLCLSSAATPRYLQDVLRALAMPAGSRLQFRYKLKWIEQRLHDSIGSNSLREAPACIAYIDQSTKEQLPQIVPLRAATVLGTEVQGDFCVIEFELDEFALALDLKVFNSEVRKINEKLPDWTEGELSGFYCGEIEGLESIVKLKANIGDWQEICKSLSGYKDFELQSFFYRVESVRHISSGRNLESDDAMMKLISGELYDIKILHYSPKQLCIPKAPTNSNLNWLLTEADEKAVTFVSANSLAIDSSYDIKSVRIRATTTTIPLDARISLLRRLAGATKPEESIWDFDLQVKIQPKWAILILQGLLVGIALAAQGLILTFSNRNISDQYSVAFSVVIAGLLAGLISSFGIRKA